MTLIARASTTVRNKNLIILAMCLVFCVWFLRDAYMRYPAENDAKVNAIKAVMRDKPGLLPPDLHERYDALFQGWPSDNGWSKVSGDTHDQMDAAIKVVSEKVGKEPDVVRTVWHSPFDVKLQTWLGFGLVGSVIAAIWWFVHCQRRRAIAEDSTVSPAPGVVIPWEKITKVDNTRWKSIGIVDITYTDAQGQTQKAYFDDYKLQRDPLLPILDLLGEKAVNAEFIDPPADEKPAAPADAPTAPPSDPAKPQGGS